MPTKAQEKYIKAHKDEHFYSNSLLYVNYCNCMPTEAKEKYIKAHKDEHFCSNSLLLIHEL